MTHASCTDTPFELDDAGFLRGLERLTRRFERLVAEGHAERFDHTDDPVHEDEELARLSDELLGVTAWPRTLRLAVVADDQALVEHCRGFLTHAAQVVSRFGLAVWLSVLIGDAIEACGRDEPTDLMPVAIRVMGHAKLERRLHGAGRGRFGGATKRVEDEYEHLRQSCRLAAYGVLSWARPCPQALRCARLLLTDPAAGLERLRSHPQVRAVCPDAPRPLGSMETGMLGLRDIADLDYLRSEHRRRLMQELRERRGGAPLDADVRYLYDADRLSEACERLWEDDETTWRPTVRKHPETVWDNPLHLGQVAFSLLGGGPGARLMNAFATRDRVCFDQMTRHLRMRRDAVRDRGVAHVPVSLVLDALAERARVGAHGAGRRTAAQNDYRWAQSDAAGVLLARLPHDDPTFVRDCALLIMRERYEEYLDKVGHLIADRATDGDDLRTAA